MKYFAIICYILPLLTQAQKALDLGSPAPTFSGIDQNGQHIQLNEVIKDSLIVLQFYRGEWCPHCNRHMSQLQDSVQLLNNLGAKVIAITPENKENIALTTSQTGASFSIVHDTNHVIMDAYKTTFKLGLIKNIGYNIAGINVKKRSEFNERLLPVPATYIIDQKGIIVGRYFNETYSERMPVSEMIKIIKAVNKGS